MEENDIVNQPKEKKQIISAAGGKSKDEMRIFLFEFFGMALFAYGIICSQGSDEFLALFFFASVCLAGPFSGAHVNPAVTLAMLLSRRINFAQAVIYWLAQFSGALCGACCCYLILNEVDSPQVKSTEYQWILSDVSGEAFGTFTFILFILIQTDQETTLTPGGQPMTTYVLVALALYSIQIQILYQILTSVNIKISIINEKFFQIINSTIFFQRIYISFRRMFKPRYGSIFTIILIILNRRQVKNGLFMGLCWRSLRRRFWSKCIF